MSEPRLCGYCRKPGHNASNCEMKSSQINDILLYVGDFRKQTVDLLVKNGIGAGALIQAYDSWNGEWIEYIIPTLSNIFNDYGFGRQVSYRLEKYSKRVFATVPSYTPRANTTNNIRFGRVDRILVPAYKLSDMSETAQVQFFVQNLQYPPEGIEYNPNLVAYFGERNSRILVPSYDCDVTNETFTPPVCMHERLTDKRSLPVRLR